MMRRVFIQPSETARLKQHALHASACAAASSPQAGPEAWAPSPAHRLEQGFEEIRAERMKGLPFLHPNVGIEAVGFQKWDGYWLGVMVTPWCMNLILSEGVASKWRSIPEGRRLNYRFPAGIYDFISVRDKTLGEYQMCSLMSPLDDVVENHALAVEIAKASLLEIMKPGAEPELGEPIPSFTKEVDPAAVEKACETLIEKPLSRRSFFRGAEVRSNPEKSPKSAQEKFSHSAGPALAPASLKSSETPGGAL